MKILILFFSVLLTITAQAQQIDIRLVTAEVASARVNSDQSGRHYHVTVKLRHTGNSPLTSGDTITLMGRGNIICKRIVGPDFPFYDSSYTFSLLGYIEDDNTFVEAMNMVCDLPHLGRHNSRDTANPQPRNYIVSLDLTDYVPLLNADKFSRLVMDHYPITGQMGFSYYSRNTTTLRWSITDRNGRRVRHGFLEVELGKRSYSLSTDGLPKGNYTFILGEGSDEDEDSFTIL